MTENNGAVQISNPLDPTLNVRNLLEASTVRQDDLREAETKRIDEKFRDSDTKYQVQFSAAREALGIALIAQEKAVASALDSTKEAINKAEVATDKRFELLSEKIDGVSVILSKNTGATGLYVTHDDLNMALDKLQASIETTLRPVVAFMNSQTGKEGVQDPILHSLVAEMKLSRESQSLNTGKGQGLNAGWVYLIGGVGLLGTIVAVFMNAITLATRVPIK